MIELDRNKLKYIVDVGLAISFLTSFVTGILKFPGLTGYFRSVYRVVSAYYISRVHDWSGLVMGILVFVHLVLNWKWIVAMTKNLVKKS